MHDTDIHVCIYADIATDMVYIDIFLEMMRCMTSSYNW